MCKNCVSFFSHVFVLVTTSLMLLQKWIIEDAREQVYIHMLLPYSGSAGVIIIPLQSQMVYEASLDSVISASVVQKDWVSF